MKTSTNHNNSIPKQEDGSESYPLLPSHGELVTDMTHRGQIIPVEDNDEEAAIDDDNFLDRLNEGAAAALESIYPHSCVGCNTFAHNIAFRISRLVAKTEPTG